MGFLFILQLFNWNLKEHGTEATKGLKRKIKPNSYNILTIPWAGFKHTGKGLRSDYVNKH